jgi:hypothetical protein
VKPLFAQAGCTDSLCHGGVAPQSEFDLRTYATLFGPGQEARNYGMCNVVPGNPDASFLIEKLLPNPRTGVQMPNNLTPLSAGQIDLLRTWIAEGAVDDTVLPGSFARGDLNADGGMNITDPISTFNYLFLNGGSVACLDAADSNDDQVVNITDGVYSLNFLYLGGPRPPAPFPSCGQDPTPDELPCDSVRCP